MNLAPESDILHDPRIRSVPWRDLVSVRRREVIVELLLPSVWLTLSFAAAWRGWYGIALGLSFMFFLVGLRVVHNAFHHTLGLPRWADAAQAQEFRALEGEEHAGLDGLEGLRFRLRLKLRLQQRGFSEGIPCLQDSQVTGIAGALFHQQFHASAHDDVKRRAIIALPVDDAPAGCSSVRSKVRVSASTSSDIP